MTVYSLACGMRSALTSCSLFGCAQIQTSSGEALLRTRVSTVVLCIVAHHCLTVACRGGLVNSYYAGRFKCYNTTASSAFASGKGLDDAWAAAYNLCIDRWSWEWQHDFGATKHPLCNAPVGDAVAISKRLLAKYKPYFD